MRVAIGGEEWEIWQEVTGEWVGTPVKDDGKPPVVGATSYDVQAAAKARQQDDDDNDNLSQRINRMFS